MLPNIYNRIGYVILSYKDKLIIPIVFSALAFLLLILFQPFEYRSYSLIRILGDSLLSAFIVLLGTGFTRVIFPTIFGNQSNSNQSVLAKEIKKVLLDIILFLLISFLINAFFVDFTTINYLIWLKASIKYVLIFEALFIPLSIFLEYYFLPESISEDVSSLEEDEIDTSYVLKFKITSNLGEDYLEILPHNVILIKSWDNYIEIFYFENNVIASSLLRNTMYNVRDMVADYPFIMQCHRSYLININAVLEVNGNARGYRLKVEGITDKIPVSRSKIALFKKTLVESKA